jgi:hypothetical protein
MSFHTYIADCTHFETVTHKEAFPQLNRATKCKGSYKLPLFIAKVDENINIVWGLETI